MTRISRRKWIQRASAAGLGAAAALAGKAPWPFGREPVFIGRVADYANDMTRILLDGLDAVGIRQETVKGKRVLLKPNLVEPSKKRPHINTHPAVIAAAAAVFRRLGASEVRVGEGAGHRRDALLVLEESGLIDVLLGEKLPYTDLNTAVWRDVPNRGRLTGLKTLAIPEEVLGADILVSMPKMKTHHSAGVTLSMKNLFGVLPGTVYGFPKNVLHVRGIERSIIDVNATARPHIAIVDGVVGMDGDGPLAGTPATSGVLVVGRNLPAVDATCCRIMDIDPFRVGFLRLAAGAIGPIEEDAISQRGESIESVRHPFRLLDKIHAHRGLRPG